MTLGVELLHRLQVVDTMFVTSDIDGYQYPIPFNNSYWIMVVFDRFCPELVIRVTFR